MVESDVIIKKNIFLTNEPDRFLISKDGNTLSINKQTNVIKQEKNEPRHETSADHIDGIIGVLEAKESNYLMTIDTSIFVGVILGHKVFCIENVNFYSFSNGTSKIDEPCVQQIKDFFKRNTFYFSQTLDLSVSYYSIAKKIDNKTSNFNSETNLFRNSQLNFLWNYSNTRVIDNELLSGIVHPIINGYIGIKPVNSYDIEFTYAIISRKETKRSGCRFIVRGADLNGNVANFAETEQLIIIPNMKKTNSDDFSVLSYLQIRGSMPFIWAQLPNLQLNPPINVSNDFSANSQAFNRHFNNIIMNYDKVCCVNLIDKKGDQKVIGEHYQDFVKKYKQSIQSTSTNSGVDSNAIDYSWFDFHSECKKMKYENLSKLLRAQSVSSALSTHDFTQLLVKKGSQQYQDNIELISRQKGVFRTNCIDNLDRTNVVQSVFGRQFLHKILYRLKISEMPQGNPFEEFTGLFEGSYRELWGGNGDILSKAYSGTNALKRDFTRTGKRTIRGAIDDGVNTSTRFYINNFCDGYNQDCHDYYLGNLNPKKKTFKAHSTFFVKSLFVSMFLLTFILYSLSTSFALKEEKEYGFKGVILKGLIFTGMFLISCLSLMGGFKQSLIDLSTISYH